jgi:hypothetical protein
METVVHAQKRMETVVHVVRITTPTNVAAVLSRVRETCLLTMVAMVGTMTRMTRHLHLPLEELWFSSRHYSRRRLKCQATGRHRRTGRSVPVRRQRKTGRQLSRGKFAGNHQSVATAASSHTIAVLVR